MQCILFLCFQKLIWFAFDNTFLITSWFSPVRDGLSLNHLFVLSHIIYLQIYSQNRLQVSVSMPQILKNIFWFYPSLELRVQCTILENAYCIIRNACRNIFNHTSAHNHCVHCLYCIHWKIVHFILSNYTHWIYFYILNLSFPTFKSL